jgi:hypothetical protein
MHTKVTQYFTDDNSAAGYSHVLTQPTESFCGTAFNYEHIYSSSLANGKWRDCLYGPYTFCSGSTSGSACASENCGQFYIDTAAITIDYTGKLGDTTANITLYTGSRLYLSSSLELAPDGYYTSGGIYYKVGKGDCCGWNDGTFISSGSCPTAPSASWNCVSGSCVDPGNGTGTYSTLAACQASCSISPATASLAWSFSETNGANGIMEIYVNGSIVETRYATTSGNRTVYVGDTIRVKITTASCSGSFNIANSYCSGILNEATCETTVTELSSTLYNVVSFDAGTILHLDSFSTCDQGCR